MKCKLCTRELTLEESIREEIGPDCLIKHGRLARDHGWCDAYNGLTEAEYEAKLKRDGLATEKTKPIFMRHFRSAFNTMRDTIATDYSLRKPFKEAKERYIKSINTAFLKSVRLASHIDNKLDSLSDEHRDNTGKYINRVYITRDLLDLISGNKNLKNMDSNNYFKLPSNKEKALFVHSLGKTISEAFELDRQRLSNDEEMRQVLLDYKDSIDFFQGSSQTVKLLLKTMRAK